MKQKSTTPAFGTSARINHDSSDFYSRNLYEDLSSTEPSPVHPASIRFGRAHKGASETAGKAPAKVPAKVNVIYCADAQRMNQLPDESTHLMITSPPYNVGKEYDQDLSLSGYFDLLETVLAETYRVLVDGGRACLNIANVGRSPYIPLHAYLIQSALRCGFSMRGEIIWDKGASAGSSCAWGSWQSASNPVLRDVHEYILVFSKGSFKRNTHDGAKGKNSITRDDFLDATKSVWRFPTTSAKRANHPAPFPLELPRRLIQLYSFEGDVVLDPFMGSGTTAVAALQSKRSYVGYEISKQYADQARKRLRNAKSELAKSEQTQSEPSRAEPALGELASAS